MQYKHIILSAVATFLTIFFAIVYIFYKTLIDDDFLQSYGAYILKLFKTFVNNPPIVDTATHFPNYRLFLDNIDKIKEKYLAMKVAAPTAGHVYNNEFKSEITSWKLMPLRLFGKDSTNQKYFPFVATLLRKCPEIHTATFSIIGPGEHIPAHTGMWLGIYKTHLNVIIPTEASCALRVADTWHEYSATPLITFEEVFEHEVRNECASDRVILIIDVPRRDLPPILQQINDTALWAIKHSRWVAELVERGAAA